MNHDDDIAAAEVSARKLASYCRYLVSALAVVGIAILLQVRQNGGVFGRPLALLVIIWCGLWLPTVRAVALEWACLRQIALLRRRNVRASKAD